MRIQFDRWLLSAWIALSVMTGTTALAQTEEADVGEEKPTDVLPVVYALIWRANETGDEANKAFMERIPQLMKWLKELKADGHLIACGGGSFEVESGGLTLIKADSPERASELDRNPLNEIGRTEILLWDVHYADIQINTDALP